MRIVFGMDKGKEYWTSTTDGQTSLDKLKTVILGVLRKDEHRRLQAIRQGVREKIGPTDPHAADYFSYKDFDKALQEMQKGGHIRQARPRSGLWLLVLVLILSLLAGCGKVEAGDPEDQDNLRSVIMSETRYMKIRDGLCVGYLWTDDNNGQSAVGGPVVFTVPCDLLAEAD